MATRPKYSTVWLRGLPYRLDLVKCRRALVLRQVDGDLDGMESMANDCGISRSTASRFFSGRATSLTVILKIEDVATAVTEDDEDEPEGPSGAGARITPAPRKPAPGMALRLERGYGA
jgi:hypothetical protein